MSKSRLDQMVEGFAEHEHMYNPATVEAGEKAFIVQALKDAIKSDIRDEMIRQLKKEARIEADNYKKSLFKKVRTEIIIETIFVAFLIGIIVNQVTYLLPESVLWAGGVIIVSLLICVLFVFLKMGND